MRYTTPPADRSSLARDRATPLLLHVDVERRTPLDELSHDGVRRVLDFLHRPDLTHPPLVQHRDARSYGIRTSHVVRDDNARDPERVAHANHELVDHRARHR